MSIKLGRVVIFHEGLPPTKLHDKLKTYLHYQSGYSHKTWENGNILFGVPVHKVTLRFDHMVLLDHMKN